MDTSQVVMTAALLASFAAGAGLAQTPSAIGGAPPPAQQLTPEMKADSDALRALAARTPALPLERVEITINPPHRLGDVSATAIDKQGRIYIFHRPKEGTHEDPIVVVDSKGRFLRSFGRGSNPMAHGIKIDPAGNVWTVDAHTSMVRKYTPEGELLLEVSVGDIPDPQRPFCGATDVAFTKNGHFYVSDGYCNARVIEYAADGKKVREWGTKGRSRGQFELVHDIAVAGDGTIFVADRENGRVQWFDPSGRYLGEKHFGGQLFSAQVGANGMIYVGTHARGTPGYDVDANVFEFDPKTGTVLGRVGTFAHQLTVGADGSLYPGPVNVKIGTDPKATAIVMFRPKE
jgi:outer membrane protein assembly factor BamB